MNFLDGHLFPENQQPLIITAARSWTARAASVWRSSMS